MDKVKIPEIQLSGDLQKYQEQFYEGLQSDLPVCEEIKKLNVSKKVVRENLGKFLSFQDDFNYCRKCPGLEKCAKENPHFEMTLNVNGDFIERNFTPCHLIQEKMKVESHFLFRDYPDEWQNYDMRNIDKSANRNELLKLLTTILGGGSKKWLFINGSHRAGKSFILAAFANSYAYLGNGQAAFANSTNRFNLLKDLSIEDKEKFARKMTELTNVGLLILDDFGNEYKSDYVRDQIVIPLLQDRAKNGLLTMFTSDFTIAEIQTMYSTSGAASIRAKQLADILRDMTGGETTLKSADLY